MRKSMSRAGLAAAAKLEDELSGNQGGDIQYRAQLEVTIAHQRKYLKLLARGGCSNFVTYVPGPDGRQLPKLSHGTCFLPYNGRRPNAKYGADRCCDQCIAWGALHPDKIKKAKP